MSEKVECFCCGKEINTALHSSCAWETPHQGLVFDGGENFGSNVFDGLLENGVVQLVICDECFTKNKHRARKIKIIQETEIKQIPW